MFLLSTCFFVFLLSTYFFVFLLSTCFFVFLLSTYFFVFSSNFFFDFLSKFFSYLSIFLSFSSSYLPTYHITLTSIFILFYSPLLNLFLFLSPVLSYISYTTHLLYYDRRHLFFSLPPTPILSLLELLLLESKLASFSYVGGYVPSQEDARCVRAHSNYISFDRLLLIISFCLSLLLSSFLSSFLFFFLSLFLKSFVTNAHNFPY